MSMITSVSNKEIVEASKLKDKKYRDQYGLFLVEGHKLIAEGIKEGFEVEKIFTLDGVYKTHERAVEVSANVLKKLSELTTPQADIAIFRKKEEALPCEGRFTLLLDRIQDPSNVGALMRSAAASGFSRLLLVDCADVYSGKCIRASMGGVFKTDFSVLKADEALANVAKNYVVIADMGGENVFEASLPSDKDILLVVGNEGQGVGEIYRKRADKTLSIPMKNSVESLNAAVSASILMYQIAKEEL